MLNKSIKFFIENKLYLLCYCSRYCGLGRVHNNWETGFCLQTQLPWVHTRHESENQQIVLQNGKVSSPQDMKTRLRVLSTTSLLRVF
jgi:hypothetical protein